MWLLGSVIIKIETLTSMSGDANRPCLLGNVYFWLLTFNIFSKWYFITKSGRVLPRLSMLCRISDGSVGEGC